MKALSPTVKSATTVDTGPEDGEVEVRPLLSLHSFSSPLRSDEIDGVKADIFLSNSTLLSQRSTEQVRSS